MKRAATTLPALILALAIAGPADAAESYSIDKDHSAILFRTHHFGAGYVYARFNGFGGTIQIDRKRPEASRVELTIEAASIYSAVRKRDDHLRSPDFLDAKQFPKLKFSSTRIERKSDESYRVTGNLELHGVTRSVSFDLDYTGEGDDPWGNHRIGFHGELTLERSDYGIKGMLGPVSDTVHIVLAIEGMRKK